MFTWIPIYKEIAEKLLEYENRQADLIEIINDLRAEDLPVISISDYDIDDKDIIIQEIDPFTFFANFNRRITDDNKIKIIKSLKERWKLSKEIPKDFTGIPTVSKQASWFFAYKKDRSDNDIPLLWQLFKEALSNSITEETFNNVLNIDQIGPGKITMGPFWIRPDQYLSLEKKNVMYLKKFGIDGKFHDYKSYQKILTQIRKYIKKDFCEISYEADEAYVSSSKSQKKNSIAYKTKTRESDIHERQSRTEPPEATDYQSERLPLNLIFYGPPGTGKTWSTVEKAVEIIDNDFYKKYKSNRDKLQERYRELENEERISMVTFHQSFSYEDFIEGIQAKTEEGKISYKIKEGIFKTICQRANSEIKKEEKAYVLIIDEINRGNISSIFGDIITLIESSKRKGRKDFTTITLPYSGKQFSAPENLYIIGTMNTADRSLTQLDSALRRRFYFEEMLPKPNHKALKKLSIEGVSISEMLTRINERIEVLFDRDHTIGHTYFLPLKDNPTMDLLSEIFRYQIIPLLQEYFFDDWEKIRLILGDNDKASDANCFIQENSINDQTSTLFGDDPPDNLPETTYYINADAFENPGSYIKIYS